MNQEKKDLYICYEYRITAEVQQKQRRPKVMSFRAISTSHQTALDYSFPKELKKRKLSLKQVLECRCTGISFAFDPNDPDLRYLTKEELKALLPGITEFQQPEK